MLAQFFTIGVLMLFSSMLPGPDFALVTKNTVLHSRRSGIFTSLGIGAGCLLHITYCSLGLAIIIANSLLLFNIIKYLGACYLIYIGIKSLLPAKNMQIIGAEKKYNKTDLTNLESFKQGFLCNILNPKATLFFLAIFTMIIKPETPIFWLIAFIIEMLLIITFWFCSLTLILSHKRVTKLLEKMEHYIAKLLGVFLICFGIALFFIKK